MSDRVLAKICAYFRVQTVIIILQTHVMKLNLSLKIWGLNFELSPKRLQFPSLIQFFPLPIMFVFHRGRAYRQKYVEIYNLNLQL